MKTVVVILLSVCLLAGCSAPVYETLGDIEHVSATLQPQAEAVLQLPSDAALLSWSGEDAMYLCGEYSIALQTLPGGDLDATLQSISGFSAEQLTVMEKICGDHTQYEVVWIAAGEGTDTVCRAAVIDDGSYHYCLTAMADADDAGQLKTDWNRLFASFCLAS